MSFVNTHKCSTIIAVSHTKLYLVNSSTSVKKDIETTVESIKLDNKTSAAALRKKNGNNWSQA